MTTETKIICFQVNGRPQQRGSKIASLIPKRGGGFVTSANGRPIVAARDANAKSNDWMRSVADAAREAFREPLVCTPVSVSITFYFARPQSHFGSGARNQILRPSAPLRHAQTPDLDKLTRAVLDACTGQIWRDDRQVCKLCNVCKEWTTGNERAVITVELLD